MGGGAVGIYATGGYGGTLTEQAGQTDAQGGGLATSSFGIICGGTAPSNFRNAAIDTGQSVGMNGGDLCGGAVSYIGYQNNAASNKPRGGNGGVGGGGGGTHND